MRSRQSLLRRSRLPEKPYVDMNRPGSPDYLQRHKETRSEIAPGMIRVDVGTALACPVSPEDAHLIELASQPTPPARSDALKRRDWRDDYGLAKQP